MHNIPIIIAFSIYTVFLFNLILLNDNINAGKKVSTFMWLTSFLALLHGIGFLIYRGYNFGWLDAVKLCIFAFFVSILIGICLSIIRIIISGITERGNKVILGYMSFIALPLAGYFMWNFS